MLRKVYSVFDKGAAFFSPPITTRTEAEAVRSFRGACQDPQTDLFRNPNDFALYRLGVFDDGNGRLITEDLPTLVAHAASMVEPAVEVSEEGEEYLAQTDLEDPLLNGGQQPEGK